MNLLSLKYFLEVAKECNITRAAKNLYISQQALSRHIVRLEEIFGLQLFNRTTPLTLTFAGRHLRERAEQMLLLRDSTMKEMADIKDFKRGELAIGISHTRGKVILPNILPKYKEMFPQVDIRLLEGNTKRLDEALELGEVDLTIGFGSYDPSYVETAELCLEHILLIMPDKILRQYFPENYDEIRLRLEQSVDIALLKECPFLMMNANNQVRRIAEDIFRTYNIRPKIVLETENIETLLALCCAGMGITFYPDMFLHNSVSVLSRSIPQDVHAYPMGYRDTSGVLFIAYRKDRYLTRAAQEFIQVAQSSLSKTFQ